MPTQTDIQQLIQQLTPSGVNNGNPNTVYNTPGTPMQPAPAVGVAPPPTMNPDGTMNMNSIPQTADLSALLPVRTSQELGVWNAPPLTNNRPQWQLPFSNLPSLGNTAPTQPTTPPPVTPSTGGGVTTGGGDFGLGGLDQDGNWSPPQGGGLFGPESPFSGHFSVMDPEFRTFYGPAALAPQVRREMGFDPATGQLDEEKTTNYLNEIAPKNEQGGIDILQTLDMLTEMFPLLNGVDWYDSDTGKLKLKENAVQIVMNALGIGPVFKFFKNMLNRSKILDRLKDKFSTRPNMSAVESPGPNPWARVLYDINPEIPEGDVFVRTPEIL
jgi:hypothetical protein